MKGAINLNKGSLLIDFHFKDMLVFEQHENLVSLDLYKNGHIFLQDKVCLHEILKFIVF